jgi:hypothetical protein
MRAKVLTLSVPATGNPAGSLRAECEREALLELRAFKRTRGLSADRLARLLGTSPDSAERWLKGECRIPAWVLKATEKLSAVKQEAA